MSNRDAIVKAMKWTEGSEYATHRLTVFEPEPPPSPDGWSSTLRVRIETTRYYD
jgi:hypothetical protein